MKIDHRPRLIALAAMVLLSVALAHAETVAPTVSPKPPGPDGNASFPDVKDSWSPDARFVVKNVDTPDDPKSPYAIFITDMKTGARTLLCSYARKAEVLWSPASDAIAINDGDANENSRSIVFRLLPSRARIDVREQFLKSHRSEQEKKLATDGRDYTHNADRIARWLDAKTVFLKVEGRSLDGKRSFLLEYAYTVGGSFRLRRRMVL